MPNPRPITATLLDGATLHREVVQEHLARARESVWIATANVKAMMTEHQGAYVPIVDVFAELARRGVALRLLHAELPSRPFRRFFDTHQELVTGGLALRICPRVHFKCVLVDGAWLYLGSANLTGAGLGAKHQHGRNFELGFTTEDFETIDHVTALFEGIWRGDECRTCRHYQRCPDPQGPGPAKPRRARITSRGDVVLGRARRMPSAKRR